jgi:hypothetical protein
MKHLRIESGKGQYSIDGIIWKDLDTITKDELLQMIDLTMEDDFTIDEYDKNKLPNPAKYSF